MIYDLHQIRTDVRNVLDMNDQSKSLINIGDMDTLMVNNIIDSVINDAARRIVEEAPVDMLELGHDFAEDIYWSDLEDMKGCGWTILPDDFFRLVAFKMSDWRRKVTEPIEDTDPEYALQSSPFVGIRGNCERPVCALSRRPEGRVLEFYSCKSEDAYAVQANYQPLPQIGRDMSIDLPKRCYRAVIYYAAGLVAMNMKDVNAANVYFNKAMEIIGINPIPTTPNQQQEQ